MRTLIIKVLNARPEEIPSVKLMLYIGFFIGIFLATYEVAAPAISLNYFKDENVLAQAFLVSGFIGVVTTYLFSYLQARIHYKVLIYYSRQFYEERDTYNYLLNRETNNVNRWTKACTLYAISQNDDYVIDDSIVAHMINPDQLLAELAKWITYKNRPEQYKRVLERLANQADVLDRIIKRVENNLPLEFDIVLMLQKMEEFEVFSGLLISPLVRQIHTVKLKEGGVSSLNRNQQEIYILQSGSLVTKYGNSVVNSPGEINIIGAIFSDLDNEILSTQARETSTILTLQLNDMFDTLTNYPHLIKQFITRVSQQYSETQIST